MLGWSVPIRRSFAQLPMTEIPTQQSPESPTPRPKRRWLQFNLRTLLVLTLVVGSGLGWVLNERRKNALLCADVNTLFKANCLVACERDGFRFKWLDRLLGRIYLAVKGVSFEPIPPVVHPMPEPFNLPMGFEEFVYFVSDRRDGGTVTDSSTECFQRLTQLEFLNLSKSAITNNGLEHLKGLTRLSLLEFNNTAITDAGLEHLKGLTNLDTLDLRGTKVTKGGVAELQKALPSCEIIHDAKD
jgi:hypothetical protein